MLALTHCTEALPLCNHLRLHQWNARSKSRFCFKASVFKHSLRHCFLKPVPFPVCSSISDRPNLSPGTEKTCCSELATNHRWHGSTKSLSSHRSPSATAGPLCRFRKARRIRRRNRCDPNRPTELDRRTDTTTTSGRCVLGPPVVSTPDTWTPGT